MWAPPGSAWSGPVGPNRTGLGQTVAHLGRFWPVLGPSWPPPATTTWPSPPPWLAGAPASLRSPEFIQKRLKRCENTRSNHPLHQFNIFTQTHKLNFIKNYRFWVLTVASSVRSPNMQSDRSSGARIFEKSSSCLSLSSFLSPPCDSSLSSLWFG